MLFIKSNFFFPKVNDSITLSFIGVLFTIGLSFYYKREIVLSLISGTFSGYTQSLSRFRSYEERFVWRICAACFSVLFSIGLLKKAEALFYNHFVSSSIFFVAFLAIIFFIIITLKTVVSIFLFEMGYKQSYSIMKLSYGYLLIMTIIGAVCTSVAFYTNLLTIDNLTQVIIGTFLISQCALLFRAGMLLLGSRKGKFILFSYLIVFELTPFLLVLFRQYIIN